MLPCSGEWPYRAGAISLPVAIVSSAIPACTTIRSYDAVSYAQRASKGRLIAFCCTPHSMDSCWSVTARHGISLVTLITLFRPCLMKPRDSHFIVASANM